MERPELYLDAAATTPPLPAVIAVMQQTAWANPSSLHSAGLAAAEDLERARWRIAERRVVAHQPLGSQRVVTAGHEACGSPGEVANVPTLHNRYNMYHTTPDGPDERAGRLGASAADNDLRVSAGVGSPD